MARELVRTPKRTTAILTALEEGGSVRAACLAGNISRSTYYKWRDTDGEFRQLTDEAVETGTDKLEDVTYKRAAESSDTLAIFLLKARRPGVYREITRHELTGADGSALTVNIGMRSDGPPAQPQ